jgi:hypothetical protein
MRHVANFPLWRKIRWEGFSAARAVLENFRQEPQSLLLQLGESMFALPDSVEHD